MKVSPDNSDNSVETEIKRSKKKAIPRAVKEQVWLRDMGKVFEGKCRTSWCKNTINLFDFQCGHNVPESRGGPTILANLIPICSRCNTSMGASYTFTEWSMQYDSVKVSFWKRYLCFQKKLINPIHKPYGSK